MMHQVDQSLSPMSYFNFPNCLPYYLMIPSLSAKRDLQESTHKDESNSEGFYLFPSRLRGFYPLNGYLSSVEECPKNISDNPICSDLQMDGSSQSESRVPQITSPIILSFNGESPKWMQKQSDLSLESTPLMTRSFPKQQARSKPVRTSEEDREYNPQDRKKKTSQKYQQNENRNIIPNEINQIFSFIQKRNKSGHILDKLFRKYPHPEEFTTKRFYLYQSLLKNRLGHYTNENSLRVVKELYEPKCENWSQMEQRFYNKICRVLIYHFLHEDSIFIILTSKRMKSEKKADHMRARRQVSRSVLSILREN